MTREEAISELQKSLDVLGMYSSKYGKVLEMAIKALRQPPDDNWENYSKRLWKAAYERGKADARPSKSNDDVSRADVLETYADIYWCDGECSNNVVAHREDMDEIYEKLRKLPAVTPIAMEDEE